MTSQTPHVPLPLVRQAWQVLEPYHAIIYFAPEGPQAYREIGLKGTWMGYFASRAAPLGAASASLVTATFYNFHPRMVQRAIPDAWRFSSPEKVLETRYNVADAVLRRLLGETIHAESMQEAATLARQAAESCSVIGRPLFAAYAALSWPQEPHMVLWHAATLLREFRGDGHIAALLTANIDGCEAHVTQAGAGAVPRETLQPYRGWSDEEWEAAQKRLRERGLLDDGALLTPLGQALRQEIEDRTDQLALAPWEHLGEAQTTHLSDLVEPFSATIVKQGAVPFPNPTGSSW